MKRFPVFSIFTIVLCAIALLPLVSISNGDDIWQYIYYDYYFDMNGNMVGFGTSTWGELDEDVATDRAVITRFHKQCTNGSWTSLTVSGYYYEKNDDGEWVYWGGSWLEWWVIDQWFNQDCN